jgi:hypothetical protein
MHRFLARLFATAVLSATALVGASVTAAPASAADCGTTFAGFGGSMSQTYKSCGGDAWVAPAYSTGGAMNFFSNECRLVKHLRSVTWNHPYTIQGATYTTVFCTDFPIFDINYYSGGSLGCWTSFSPTAPQGGPMNHYYGNCSPGVAVTPAYHGGGNWHMDNSATSWVDRNETIEWRYSSTATNVNYTTVFAVFLPDLT